MAIIPPCTKRAGLFVLYVTGEKFRALGEILTGETRARVRRAVRIELGLGGDILGGVLGLDIYIMDNNFYSSVLNNRLGRTAL